MTTLYHYDSKTGEYLNSTTAQTWPGTSDPIIPGNSTVLVPPSSAPTGQAIVFNVTNNQWEFIDDLRGVTYWVPTDGFLWDEYQVEYLGEPLRPGAVLVEPPKSTEQLIDEAKVRRNDLLIDSDWTQLLNAPLDPITLAEWTAYRQLLRDITLQPGYPENIEWPTPPT